MYGDRMLDRRWNLNEWVERCSWRAAVFAVAAVFLAAFMPGPGTFAGEMPAGCGSHHEAVAADVGGHCRQGEMIPDCLGLPGHFACHPFLPTPIAQFLHRSNASSSPKLPDAVRRALASAPEAPPPRCA